MRRRQCLGSGEQSCPGRSQQTIPCSGGYCPDEPMRDQEGEFNCLKVSLKNSNKVGIWSATENQPSWQTRRGLLAQWNNLIYLNKHGKSAYVLSLLQRSYLHSRRSRHSCLFTYLLTYLPTRFIQFDGSRDQSIFAFKNQNIVFATLGRVLASLVLFSLKKKIAFFISGR